MPIDPVTGIFTPRDTLIVDGIDLLSWIHAQNRDLKPTQIRALISKKRFIAQLDTVGVGKTTMACIDMMVHMLQYPGNFGFFGRAYYKDFKRSVYPILTKMYPEGIYPVKYHGGINPTGMTIWCPSGGSSEVAFVPFLSPTNWPSTNVGWFACDQAEELDDKWGEIQWPILAYTRLGRVQGLPPDAYKSLLIGNQMGMNWIYMLFFEGEGIPTDLDVDYSGEFDWIQAEDKRENEDNLDPGFYDRAQALGTKEMVDRLINARADTFIGRAIPEFSMANQDTYVKDFSLDSHERYRKIVAFDYGHHHPSAFLFSAVDTKGRLSIVSEYERAGLEPPEHVYQLKKCELESGISHLDSRNVADWNLNSPIRTKSGDLVRDEYRKLGWRFSPAIKTHRSIMRIKEFFRIDPVLGPMVRIHRRCRGLIRQLFRATWDEKKPEHVLKHPGKDDLFDSFCYTVMEAPRPRLSFDSAALAPGSWAHLMRAQKTGLAPRVFERES